MGVSVSTYIRRCRWAINVCVVLCCVHSYLRVSLVHNNMCVSKSDTAYFRYTHVTVGMESYAIVLVIRLYDGELFPGCLAISGLADSLLRKSHFAPRFKGRIEES